MRGLPALSAVALTAASLAPASFADGRNPGSVLVYPIHRSGGAFTVICVTNVNTTPATPFSFGGTTNVQFDYLNTIPNPADPQLPLGCFINDRVETLTPADTLCVLTACHNASDAEGYVVVTAQDPAQFKTPWNFNCLVGSELVVTEFGGSYAINAIPFDAIAGEGPGDHDGQSFLGSPGTDVDGDGELDFDGVEYEGVPDELYIPNFVAALGSSLTLINLTGGTEHTATVKFDIWNDNEFPLSATKQFRCWFEETLEDVSPVFSESYLANNTPNDPQELDVDCDNDDDLETGWARITGLWASSSDESIMDPAILGAITAGPVSGLEGGILLWESEDKQFNGDFLHFSTNHPEY